MKYILVEESNKKMFEDKVNDLIAKGYDLYGPPFVQVWKDRCYYHQALFGLEVPS